MRTPDVYDGLICCGLMLLGFGIYLISLPAALITIGIVFIALGIFGARVKAGGRQN